MRRAPRTDEVADELLESIRATPKQQRRLLSKTFWARFGFKMRTKERVEQVQRALARRHIHITLSDGDLGTEEKDDWITLSYIDPDPLPPSRDNHTEGDVPVGGVPIPDPEWFDQMAGRLFETEREVEYYFVMPLLERLGFGEPDFAIGYAVEMYEGVHKSKKHADLVIFDGEERDDALLVVEAKRMDRPLTDDVTGQAKAYAFWLRTPYYLLTNGVDIRLYHFRGPWQSDVLLMAFLRSELQDHWIPLYERLNRATVVEFKRRLKEQIAASQETAVGATAATLVGGTSA